MTLPHARLGTGSVYLRLTTCALLCLLQMMNAGSVRAGERGNTAEFEIPEGAYQATFIRDEGSVSHLEFTGNYDRTLPGEESNAAARAVVAREFLRTHADEVDFLVTFTTFEFKTGDALAFALPVQNKVQGIGIELFDHSDLFGSQGRLQSYIDMASLGRYSLDPLSPGYEQALVTLAHETLTGASACATAMLRARRAIA